MTEPGCRLCGDRCAGADLGALVQPELAWIWYAVAGVADRRGDADLTQGAPVTVTGPATPADRAAAAGFFPGPVAAGQARRLDLPRLTKVVRRWGPLLTPGAVAAHATGRPLAVRAASRAALTERVGRLRDTVLQECASGGVLGGEEVFEHLRRSGWIARVDRADAGPETVRRAVQTAGLVCDIPPQERRDRRRLVPGDPHALDDGTFLAGLTLAVLTGAGILPPGVRSSRQAWEIVGVDCDEVQGGLSTLGVHPAGWVVPPGAICTLPPRELRRCGWPSPEGMERRVFVTENPSVLAAAADAVTRDSGLRGRARLVCTMGTPSGVEIASLALLAVQGWQVWVRADFDQAGLRHVTSLLAGIEGARPWRMGVDDYLRTLAVDDRSRAEMDSVQVETPWEPALAAVMRERSRPGYEEALMPLLLADLTGTAEPTRW